MRASADSRERPVTSGTSTCSGPELMKTLTVSPRSTTSPAPGTERIASPSSTESEERLSRSALRPRSSSRLTTCLTGRFATEGTRTVPGPPDTSSSTVEPSSASSPGSGS